MTRAGNTDGSRQVIAEIIDKQVVADIDYGELIEIIGIGDFVFKIHMRFNTSSKGDKCLEWILANISYWNNGGWINIHNLHPTQMIPGRPTDFNLTKEDVEAFCARERRRLLRVALAIVAPGCYCLLEKNGSMKEDIIPIFPVAKQHRQAQPDSSCGVHANYMGHTILISSDFYSDECLNFTKHNAELLDRIIKKAEHPIEFIEVRGEIAIIHYKAILGDSVPRYASKLFSVKWWTRPINGD